MALTLARGSRAVPHAAAYDAVHDAFMTLPPYTRKRRGREAGAELWREKRLSHRSLSPRESNTRAHGTAMSSHFSPGDSRFAHPVGFPTWRWHG